MPLNPTQVGLLVWIPIILLRYRRIRLEGVLVLLWVLPWQLWESIMTNDFAMWEPTGALSKAIIYSIIACQLSNECDGRYLKCLMGLCFGAIFVAAAFWASHLGLPLTLTDWGGERSGIQRLGSVRADAVMVWPALLIGFGGLCGLLLAFASKYARTEMPRALRWILSLLILLGLPPLFATMTNGAYIGLAIMLLTLIILVYYGNLTRVFTWTGWTQIVSFVWITALIAIVTFATDTLGVRSQFSGLAHYYDESATEQGMAASRTPVWSAAVHTILEYPLFGPSFSGGGQETPSEYLEGEGYYLAHNIFLDSGKNSGIPGMIFCAVFFFLPAYRMWRSGLLFAHVPFFLVYGAFFIFWMSLSFGYYKTFWAFWMLMAMAAHNARSLRLAVSLESGSDAPTMKSENIPAKDLAKGWFQAK